ncbi:MAG: hypothetical protein IPQ07_41060 [Myxococcales bacterium]|nr:hypothetical protein [Myxococcales bacterium]
MKPLDLPTARAIAARLVAADVGPVPPTADERRDRWARSEPRRRLGADDLSALGRAQSKRERKGAARLARSALTVPSRSLAVVRSKGDAARSLVATVFGWTPGAGRAHAGQDFRTPTATLGPDRARRGRGRLPPRVRRPRTQPCGAVRARRLDLLRRYLTSTGRAELEAEAERGAVEGWWVLTGTIPADLGAVDITRHGYALDDSLRT